MIEEIKFDKRWIIPLLITILAVGFIAFIIGLLYGWDKGFDTGWEGCEDWFEEHNDTIRISIEEINVNHEWKEVGQIENEKISSNKND